MGQYEFEAMKAQGEVMMILHQEDFIHTGNHTSLLSLNWWYQRER